MMETIGINQVTMGNTAKAVAPNYALRCMIMCIRILFDIVLGVSIQKIHLKFWHKVQCHRDFSEPNKKICLYLGPVF